MLMMTAESMLLKRPVLRFTVVIFFLFKLFSSHVYCGPIPIYLYKIANMMIIGMCRVESEYSAEYLGIFITRTRPSIT